MLLKMPFLRGLLVNLSFFAISSQYSARKALKRKLKSQLMRKFEIKPARACLLSEHTFTKEQIQKKGTLLVKLFPKV
ncbi:hypothetical protein A3L09_10525 [Thermococcus profundus]|uniref:Uncharacterized protein n=1 Tax=Thermococcus profundus TaxID=49899 RepID=A0A2Z2MMM6_THEPR|nr:hypothetical protein A3L09_10525 [Thermococcus profundus]